MHHAPNEKLTTRHALIQFSPIYSFISNFCCYLGLFITIELVSSSFLTNTLTVKEQYRLALKLQQQPADLASAFYSVSGLKALNKEVNDVDSFCQVATKNVKQDDAESVYQFSEVVKHLKCKVEYTSLFFLNSIPLKKY